jgi:uncharacterized membrane protein
MRQLLAWVPREQAEHGRDLATAAGATHAGWFEAHAVDEPPTHLLVVNMPNERFDDVVGALGAVPDVRLVFQRDSVVVLEPPAEALPEQVTDVTTRGPLEMFVEGLQSLGAWPGFLAYSVVAGVIVFAGFVSNTVFLLTAAMLIAPYAAPAMTAALASARGDAHLLRRSVGRYLASVGVSTATAAVLALLFGVSEVSELMLEVADVPAVAVLLPLAAAVAGALSFNQPDRTGIVSGAGVGMLVALALAPQAGLMGIGAVLGEARLVGSAAFVAALQLVGINVAGALVFRLLGVGTTIPRARAGARRTVWLAGVVSAVTLLAMLGLQWATHPELSREAVVVQVEAATTATLDEQPGFVAVGATARFPLGGDHPTGRLAVEGRIVATGDPGTPSKEEMTAAVRQRLLDDFPDIDPLVSITVAGG